MITFPYIQMIILRHARHDMYIKERVIFISGDNANAREKIVVTK
jgi:hypothetical protein